MIEGEDSLDKGEKHVRAVLAAAEQLDSIPGRGELLVAVSMLDSEERYGAGWLRALARAEELASRIDGLLARLRYPPTDGPRDRGDREGRTG